MTRRRWLVIPALLLLGAGCASDETPTVDEVTTTTEEVPVEELIPRAETTVATQPPVTSPPATAAPRPAATAAPSRDVYYANCSEARAAGAAPLHRGEPGYRSGLDRDNDGVACE